MIVFSITLVKHEMMDQYDYSLFISKLKLSFQLFLKKKNYKKVTHFSIIWICNLIFLGSYLTSEITQ